jgi:hypothetical protein
MPDAYLVTYKEVTNSGTKQHCVIASLEPHAPTIMANEDNVRSRELICAKPLYAAPQPSPIPCKEVFGYFHELLNHEGKGTGVWLGTPSKKATEQSYIEGEVGKEIVALCRCAPYVDGKEVVGWRGRYICPVEGPSLWVPLTKELADFHRKFHKDNWEVEDLCRCDTVEPANTLIGNNDLIPDGYSIDANNNLVPAKEQGRDDVDDGKLATATVETLIQCTGNTSEMQRVIMALLRHVRMRPTANDVIEMCAKVCDEQMTEPECPERAQYCAAAIRQLKEPTQASNTGKEQDDV